MTSILPSRVPLSLLRRLTVYKRELSLPVISRSYILLHQQSSRYYSSKMTSTHANNAAGAFSTTNTQHADPYKEKNLDTTTSLKEKVEDLVSFIEGLKFGMMVTRQRDSGLLVSRCMAVAARVRFSFLRPEGMEMAMLRLEISG